MIEAYKRDNTDYEKNGDMTLFPESCTVTAELNGAWCMDILHPLDEEGRWKYITEEAVIAAPTFMGKKQLFRVDDVEKTDTDVTAKAYPIFFDSADDCFLFDVRPTGKNGQQALNEMTAGSKYHAQSDITSGSTAYFIRRNLMDAINGEDSPTFIERWGGEILYDNYTVLINRRAGADYGVEIRYGKNMTAVRYHVDMSGVVTRIVPVAYNGYMMASGKYVDSSNIGKYAKIYTKEIRFENIRMAQDAGDGTEANMVICKNQKELDAALREACMQQYASGIDLPAVTLEVDLVELSNTEEYKDLGILETIGLGDTVHCYNRNLDVSTEARAIKIKWDCIYGEIRTVTLGDYERNYFRDMASSAAKIESVISDDGSLMAERVKGILSGMQTQLRLQNTAAKKQEVRAILFEDLDPESEFYGALSIGTQGWEIANKRTADGRDWAWTTAATANGIVADAVITGLLSDKNGVNFWNLDTGEFSLSSTAKVDGETIGDKIQNAVKGQELTQEKVLDKLTDGGKDKGIYLLNGKLYISFDAARGGTLTLGGANNVSGILRVLDASGEEIGIWDKDGVHLKKGEINGPSITVGGRGNKEGVINVLNSSGYKTIEFNSNGMKFFDGSSSVFGRARFYGTSDGFFIQVMSNTSNGIYTVGLTTDGLFDMGSAKIRLNGGTGEVQLPQKIYGYAVPQSTVGSGATFVSESSSFNSSANYRLYRGVSSSGRYKDIGRDMTCEDVESLYNITPVWAKFKNSYLDERDERYGIEHPMFIAEDVEKYAPLAVDHNKNGAPENWNYRIMIPCMFQMLKSQKSSLEHLSERIERLEKLLSKGKDK